MTALSRRHASECWNFADLTHVARLSLVTWGVMAFGSAGCLVTESPEFKAPVRAGDTVRATVSVRQLLLEKRLVWLTTVGTVKDTVVITGEALVKVGTRAA